MSDTGSEQYPNPDNPNAPLPGVPYPAQPFPMPDNGSEGDPTKPTKH